MANHYVSSVAYAAVTQWAASTAYSVGDLRRPTAPQAVSERVYRCTTAGTSGASEPSAAGGNPWNLAHGGTTTDGGVTWTEVTGQETYNWSAPYARLESIAHTGPAFKSITAATPTANAGSGYAVGDIIKVNYSNAFDTGIENAVLKVASIGGTVGTVPLTFTVLSGGQYGNTTIAAGTTTTTITGSGSGCTLASATFNNPNTWYNSGDNIFVSQDHSEVRNETASGGMSIGAPQNAALPVKLICVNRAGSVPPTQSDITTGAAIGSSSTIQFTTAGNFHAYGITLFAGQGQSTTTPFIINGGWWDHCLFQQLSTGSSASVLFQQNNNLRNSTIQFTTAGQSASTNGTLNWRNDQGYAAFTSPGAGVSGASATNVLGSNSAFRLFCDGLDFSGFPTARPIFGINSTGRTDVYAKDCKFASGATKANTVSTFFVGTQLIQLKGSRVEYKTGPVGTLAAETTIVRTGGATDGTTPYSWLLTTTANNSFSYPFECPPIAIWNDTVGSSVTVTIEGVASAVLTEDDLFIEVTYPADSAGSDGLVTTKRAVVVGTPANLTTSTAAWASLPATPQKFNLSKAFTPQAKGYIYVYAFLAKASASAIYIDPKPVLT